MSLAEMPQKPGREIRAQTENPRTAAAQEGAQPRRLSASDILSLARPAEPPMAGIYFLIRERAIVYVGKASHVPCRLYSHGVGGKVFDAWAWLPCPLDQQSALERLYIDAFLPEYNMDLATRNRRGDFKSDPTPSVGHPLSNASPEMMRELAEEWRQIIADPETVTEDMVWRERMHRLRAVKADPTVNLSDFGPMPVRNV